MKILSRAIIVAAFAAGVLNTVKASETDYTKGIMIVNEDWYGHQNSTVNYLLPDDIDGYYWRYRIVQAENPGKELGCTNQYGAIWNGRIGDMPDIEDLQNPICRFATQVYSSDG